MSTEPDARAALQEASREAGWTNTRIAFEVGLTEGAIQKFFRGETKSLGGDAVLALMRKLPGFATRLGFRPLSEAEALPFRGAA